MSVDSYFQSFRVANVGSYIHFSSFGINEKCYFFLDILHFIRMLRVYSAKAYLSEFQDRRIIII